MIVLFHGKRPAEPSPQALGGPTFAIGGTPPATQACIRQAHLDRFAVAGHSQNSAGQQHYGARSNRQARDPVQLDGYFTPVYSERIGVNHQPFNGGRAAYGVRLPSSKVRYSISRDSGGSMANDKFAHVAIYSFWLSAANQGIFRKLAFQAAGRQLASQPIHGLDIKLHQSQAQSHLRLSRPDSAPPIHKPPDLQQV
jgi:hypothetical protein